MKLNFSNWTDFHHNIYRIYHGIIAISLIPFFLVFLELEVTDIKEARVTEALIYVILVILIPLCLWLMWKVWKGGMMDQITIEELTLKDKLITFRRTEIRKYLILELACVLGLLGLWLTAHYLFVILYFAVLAQFSFLRPSEDRFVRDMRLTKEDRKKLHEEWI